MYQPNYGDDDINNNNNNYGDDDINNNNINNNDINNDMNNNINYDVGVNFGNEEFESGNTSTENHQEAGGSGVHEQLDAPGRKRKRYHRHTQHQIHEMEAFFKECPHPDEKQRRELGRQIGLGHLQIKFWFQNKRTQHKNQQERHENAQLRAEKERLTVENQRYQEAFNKATCPNCDGQTAIGEMSFEEHHVRLENARLREEVARLGAMMERIVAKRVMNYPLASPPIPQPPPPPFEVGAMGNVEGDVYENGGNLSRPTTVMPAFDKPTVVELAGEAMEELMIMTQVDEPLWMAGANGMSLALNLDEYTRLFQKGLGPRLNGFRTEASRGTAVVAMNHIDIVNILMNQNQWSTMFAGMIAKAVTFEVVSTGVAASFNDEAFHMICAEYQVLSPLVPTRESCFVRYCKQQGEGIWAVVDVSIDHLVPNLNLKCRRRPSGCLIQEIPNGFSRVTWVEHVEVDDGGKVHDMYQQLITTGQALGAIRWLATLDRQSERLASIMATDPSEPDGLIRMTIQGKNQIMKLADRMARIFFSGVTASTEHLWYVLPGGTGDDIKVMTSKSLNEAGRPPGVILCAVTSFWVPVPPKTVFYFLSDENTRDKWDVLSTGGMVQKIAEISNGRDMRNCVSLLRTANTSHSKMMMIQETSTDPTASFVLYAPVDIAAIDIVIGGGDSDCVNLLPSGIAILPDGTAQPGEEGGGGSLLTVASQMLVEPLASESLTISSVATIENLVRVTVDNIKALAPCYPPCPPSFEMMQQPEQ